MEYKPKGLYLDEFEVGQEFLSAGRTITEADTVAFAGLSGDFNPLHTDETFATSTPFGTRIAHGMLSAAVGTGLANQLGIFEGTTIALLGMTINWKGAVKFGDTVRVKITIKEVRPKTGKGILVVHTDTVNQEGKTVVEGDWTLMMKMKEQKETTAS